MSPKTPFRIVAALLVALLTLNLPMIVSAAEQADALAHELVPHDHGEDAGTPTDGSHDRHCMPSCQTVAGMLTEPPSAVGLAVASVTLHRPADTVLQGKTAAPDPPPPRRHPVL
ncbi:hypothetical protein C882_2871 [Caenispirillum salinarum AK4]|uniref:Uncharacterized protein n=1 Tax=Caenispirillum salinarum AK4 TaxID=1238182 RepID=K9GNI1_9PROT|nr:hypothetical protein [Caenispirillum salinarum]EKV26244.1 hypothetical protein C882_2871 [Caenispirillum salinarum AK4]